MDIIKENFDKIFSALNGRILAALKRDQMAPMTFVCFGDFGEVVCQHLNAYRVERTAYAQHKNALRLRVKKKGGSVIYQLILHEGMTFALFDGWATPTEKMPQNFWSFDKAIFSRIVDSIEGEKIGENSDRQRRAKMEAVGQTVRRVYHVVKITGVEVYGTEAELLERYHEIGRLNNTVCRHELQNTPRLSGLCGAMYDGTDEEGRAVIRYEDQAINEMMRD